MRIEKYAPRWHSKVIQLANQVFGEGYFASPWEIATEPGSVMLVAHDAGVTLLGFAQGRVLPRSALRDYLEQRVTDIPPEIEAADAIGALGAIHAVAVAQNQRRQGIGKKLLLALHNGLIGHGADKLIVTFKRGPSAARVDSLMGKLGFDEWMRLPSYWQESCDRGEFNCVDRRDGCTCEAVFYRKSVY